MARYNYDRLTALDHSFLLLERPNSFMHVASVALHDSGPLRSADGGIDIDLIRQGILGLLHRIPRYRQKLARIPISGAPIWIDDEEFNLDFHIRHTSLPRPGDAQQLKRLAARIMAQRLDRSRPLWELWVIEGLEGERFAMINKTHHCMIGGPSGVDLMNVMMSPSPDAEIVEAPPFVPRRAPSRGELIGDELMRRLSLPLEAVRDISKLAREAAESRRDLLSRIRQLAQTLGATLRPASPTPLNQPIGPHRRFDWTTHEIADLKEIRRALGGSLNDVVLSIVTGAVRRFLGYRRVDVEDLDFRVMAPVSVRNEAEGGRLGNRVSAWFVPLPLDEADPSAQLRDIAAKTQELKETKGAIGAEILIQAAEWTPATLLSLGARNATRLQPFNLVVTNVPGPQLPLHLLGARMEETYPMVPLAERLGLGIALFSYNGRMHWGFNADYELVPDLERFVGFIEEAFAELQAAARDVAAPPTRSARATGSQPAAEA